MRGQELDEAKRFRRKAGTELVLKFSFCDVHRKVAILKELALRRYPVPIPQIHLQRTSHVLSSVTFPFLF